MDKEYSRELPFPFIQPNRSLPANLSPGNRKAKRDFVFCADRMDEMLPKDVEHILILEDDMLVMEGIFSTLSAWMTYHQERLQAEAWLDIKLYLNPRLCGWAWNRLPLVELLSSTSLLSTILHVILWLAFRIRRLEGPRLGQVWSSCGWPSWQPCSWWGDNTGSSGGEFTPSST